MNKKTKIIILLYLFLKQNLCLFNQNQKSNTGDSLFNNMKLDFVDSNI